MGIDCNPKKMFSNSKFYKLIFDYFYKLINYILHIVKMFKKVALHIQIIIALIVGSLFGALFAVNQNLIVIKNIDEGRITTTELTSWDSFKFIIGNEEINFNKSEKQKIFKSFEKLNSNKITVEYIKGNDTYKLENIVAIEKEKTLPIRIKWIGTLFIRLLSFLAIPLVISSLIVGAASLDNIKKLGRIGLRTFAIYVTTTAIAITIGLGIANIMEPGKQVDNSSKELLLGSYETKDTENAVQNLDIDVIDFFVNIVPKNPLEAIASGEMLQIVFASIIFGITLTFVEKRYSEPVLAFFEGVSQTMIKMVDIIMLMAPIGVFALISATIADFGFNILYTLIWYCLAVVIGLLIQTTIVYGGIVSIFGKIGIGKFFSGLKNAQAIAFSTSSSAATLPITFDCVENNLGVKKEISGFVLPLGATINMDGTALYQGVAAVFIAQVYGLDLNLTQQLTVVLTAVLASIGTAPVPGVGLIMLVLILDAVNVPKEGIALILGVDRILDMLRTVTNVTGDSAVVVAINGLESKK